MSRDTAGTSVDIQVFTPFRRGMPAIGTYARELWDRRAFAYELARTELRTQNSSTGLGQIWLVLNPLLLTFVYYLLTSILSGGNKPASYLVHIMAGLFVYYFFSGSVIGGASSILSSGRLIMNTAFPKMLLPLSVVLFHFLRFLPTLVIFSIVRALAGVGFSWNMLWGILPLMLIVVFACGLAMLTATLNLYFRDTKAFLPYAMRIWLYISPILFTVEQLEQRHGMAILKFINPLVPLIGSWTMAVGEGEVPSWRMLGGAALWAVGALLVGGYALLSREREFAVRL